MVKHLPQETGELQNGSAWSSTVVADKRTTTKIHGDKDHGFGRRKQRMRNDSGPGRIPMTRRYPNGHPIGPEDYVAWGWWIGHVPTANFIPPTKYPVTELVSHEISGDLLFHWTNTKHEHVLGKQNLIPFNFLLTESDTAHVDNKCLGQ